MKATGYNTGATGKWHLDAFQEQGKDYVNNYTQTQVNIRQAGFDYAEGIYPHNIASTDPFSHNL
eukprot:scaffold648832_cov24-Prasinocladus_malaysianus.AAC.1